MKISLTAGGAVLRIADILQHDDELGPMSVEGALLSFDFTGLNVHETLDVIVTMNHFIQGLISTGEGEALEALGGLRRVLEAVEAEALREHNLIYARESKDAAVDDAGSQPTSIDDALIESAATQSSVSTIEETPNVEAEQEADASAE